MKKEPKGNNVAPIKSESTAIKIFHFGPSHMAQRMAGTKEKLIVTIGVLTDKNRDKIISMASSKAANIIFLFFDIFNSPYYFIFSLILTSVFKASIGVNSFKLI